MITPKEALPPYKLLISFAMVLILVGLLMAILPSPPQEVRARGGQVDLRWWSSSMRTVKIVGDLEWIPGELVFPGRGATRWQPFETPGLWRFSSDLYRGVATYRMVLAFEHAPPTDCAIHLPEVDGSYRVFLNGQLIGEAGVVSERPEIQRDAGIMTPFHLSHLDKTVEIIIQHSSFGYRYPGIHAAPIFGTSQEISRYAIRTSNFDMGLMLATFILVLYVGILYLFRPAERPIPALLAFALALGLRHLLKNTRSAFSLVGMLDTLWVYPLGKTLGILAFGALVLYFQRSLPWYFKGWRTRIIFVVNLAFALAVPFNTPRTMGIFLFAYFIFQVPAFYCLLMSLSTAGRMGITAAWIHAASLLVFEVAFGVDNFSEYTMVSEAWLMAPTMLGFFLIHAFLFSWRIVDTYEQSQLRSTELKGLLSKQDEVQEELERTVAKRTKELSLALEESTKASSAKSKFLANVSHEIRTPLNAVIGFTEILKEHPDSPTRAHFFRMILFEAQRLQALLDQLLDFSKIEANKLVLENNPFDLHELLRTINASMQLQTKGTGLSFSTRMGPGVPLAVRGDPLRLHQVLDNLLSNALKFTEEGSISLSVDLLSQGAHSQILEFSVADTGIGIPADRLEHIFESFEQADTSTTRIYGGTGLGTTISKQLVELMGGNIRIASELGKGTTFTFTVLLKAADPQELEPSRQMKDHKVPAWSDFPVAVVAEDYQVNAELVTRHLLEAGWIVRQAENGQKALDLVVKEKPQLVLMDIQMPVMDGYEATRRIRALEGPPIPVVGLSANAFEEDRRRCLQAGMDELLAKPVRRRQLLETLARYVPPSLWKEREEGKPGAPRGVLPRIPLMEELEGDLASFLEILGGFLDSLASSRSELAAALDRGDTATAHRLAHGIKGSAMNVGAPALEHAARAVEQAAKLGNLDQARTLSRTLDTEIHRLIAAATQLPRGEDPATEDLPR